MTIYVIDDHPLMREAVVMLLRRVRPGSEVVELSQLSDLDRAVETRGAPELFCLDLKLPDTLGLSGVRLVSQQYPEVPLAVISATPATKGAKVRTNGRKRATMIVTAPCFS